MLINKIELPTTITFDGKFFLVDHDVYSYDPEEVYQEGVFVTYQNQIFKCKKKAKGVIPEQGEYFELLNKGKSVTVSLNTANVEQLSAGSSAPIQDVYTKSESDNRFLAKSGLPDTSKFAVKTEVQKQLKTIEDSVKVIQEQIKTLQDSVKALQPA